KILGDEPLREGRVKIDIPQLADNGNSVLISITVESPMTPADHVKAIHILSEKNPLANIVRFSLGPRAGVARVQTSIRLALTQKVTIVAEMSDGSFWGSSAETIVTAAACLEDT
ncbi:MAG: sulfur oxidation protein SoxY, partial [Hyphomicrobiaceae bacterium]